jgi:hypothetical protein
MGEAKGYWQTRKGHQSTSSNELIVFCSGPIKSWHWPTHAPESDRAQCVTKVLSMTPSSPNPLRAFLLRGPSLAMSRWPVELGPFLLAPALAAAVFCLRRSNQFCFFFGWVVPLLLSRPAPFVLARARLPVRVSGLGLPGRAS